MSRGDRHTNGSNDGGTAVVPCGRHIRAELGVPLQLHTVAEMVERACGSHGVDLMTVDVIRTNGRPCV